MKPNPFSISAEKKNNRTKLRLNLFILLCLLFTFVLFASDPENKVIVLGIAQDAGIPQIGCDQQTCRTQHHFVTSLALVSGNALYLFDATPDLREQHRALVQRYPNLARKNLFDGIFLTHAHMGHYTGLMFLGKESISTDKVPVYCSKEMTKFLTANAPWSLLVTNRNIELHPFVSGTAMEVGGIQITPIAVPHRKEFSDTHGFLIRGPKKALLFIPDIDSWEPVRDVIAKAISSSDFALLDGTFYSGNELPGRDIRLVPHPTVESSVRFFGNLPPFSSQIFFIHLNHTNPLLDPGSTESRAFSRSGYKIAQEWQEFGL